MDVANKSLPSMISFNLFTEAWLDIGSVHCCSRGTGDQECPMIYGVLSPESRGYRVYNNPHIDSGLSNLQYSVQHEKTENPKPTENINSHFPQWTITTYQRLLMTQFFEPLPDVPHNGEHSHPEWYTRIQEPPNSLESRGPPLPSFNLASGYTYLRVK